MTRDMKDELLFEILFLGFLRFAASFPLTANSIVFPSPNAGADACESGDLTLPLVDVLAPPSLPNSKESRPSLGCSCMLAWTPDLGLAVVLTL
jgi:hypothetical protein